MSTLTRRLAMRASIIALTTSLAGGCGGGLTRTNYDKIKEGMTLSEVEAILGKGTEQASSNTGGAVEMPGMSAGGISIPGQTIQVPSMSGKAMVWQEGMKIISITFLNGKVMAKAQTGL